MTDVGDVLAVLAAIDRGDIALRMTTPHAAERDGRGTMYPEYEAANGWRFCVFDDCGGWDYLEWFQPPTGARVTFPDRLDADDPLWAVFMQFRSENEAAWHWAQNGLSPSGYRA